MTYLDEDIIVRLNNLNPTTSGQYFYEVRKDGQLVFTGYTYLEKDTGSKKFNISDICAHYRWDCKELFESIAAYNVEASYFSTYTVSLTLGGRTISGSEEVAHIYRYPTNTSDNYLINKDYPNSYTPLLQSTKVKDVQYSEDTEYCLYETSFLPHYPKVNTNNYGVGIVMATEEGEIPVITQSGSDATLPNNSYLPLNEVCDTFDSIDVTLGSCSYEVYNIEISNISYNFGAMPITTQVNVLRQWMDDVMLSFATPIADFFIAELLAKSKTIVLEVETIAGATTIFNQIVTQTIPKSNGTALFSFGSVNLVSVQKTNNRLSSAIVSAPSTIKVWNGSSYSTKALTVDAAVRIPYSTNYIYANILNARSVKLQSTFVDSYSGMGSINFKYNSEMRYIELVFFSNDSTATDHIVGRAQWDLSKMGLADGQVYAFQFDYATEADTLYTTPYSYVKNWVVGLRALQPFAILDECPAKFYLQWQDRYGGIQSQPFTGKYVYKEDITRSSILNYTNEKKITQSVVQPKWELSTGWIAEEDYPYYESIFISPYLKLYDTEKNVTYLVTITDTSFTEKNWKNSKQLLNITLNLEAAKPQTILS